MNVTKINEERDHELEGDQRELYGRIWSEEMEEENDVSIL